MALLPEASEGPTAFANGGQLELVSKPSDFVKLQEIFQEGVNSQNDVVLLPNMSSLAETPMRPSMAAELSALR